MNLKEIEKRLEEGYCLDKRVSVIRDMKWLLQRIRELEAENKDWKFKASCHVSQCIADYEDLEKRIKELEEGIRKYLAGWDKYHPNRNIYVLEKLIE